MSRALKWIGNITFWCSLAALAGASYGYEQGYRKGVRDIGSLVLKLHEAPEMPERRSSKEDL